MKKITLILVALITVGCSDSDPKDKYIALECIEFSDYKTMYVMDKDSKTFETYTVKTLSDDPTIVGPENIITSGTYIEEGDHHYLYTWDLETFEELNSISPVWDDETVEMCSFVGQSLPLPQYKIDRRDFSLSGKELDFLCEPYWSGYEKLD